MRREVRQRIFLRGQKCPVFTVFGAGEDPGAELLDTGGSDGFLPLGWRHDFVFVRTGDTEDQWAGIGVAGDNGGAVGLAADERAFASVEAEARLAGAGILAVAMETMVGEDGADITFEVRRRGCGVKERRCDEPHRDDQRRTVCDERRGHDGGA